MYSPQCNLGGKWHVPPQSISIVAPAYCVDASATAYAITIVNPIFMSIHSPNGPLCTLSPCCIGWTIAIVPLCLSKRKIYLFLILCLFFNQFSTGVTPDLIWVSDGSLLMGNSPSQLEARACDSGIWNVKVPVNKKIHYIILLINLMGLALCGQKNYLCHRVMVMVGLNTNSRT